MKFSLSALILAFTVLAPALAAPVEVDNVAVIVVRDDTPEAVAPARRHEIDARQINSASPGLKVALNSAYRAPFSIEQYRLAEFVTYTRDRLVQAFPGHNIFIYHRFKDSVKFRWSVNDAHYEEAEVQKVDGLAREFYKILVFKGPGTLIKQGDGGFENWAFAGSYNRVGDNVNFT